MGVTSYYSFGGEIIGEETGGVRRDYLTDALGSVTATVTGAGVVENTYRYKPYGEQLAKTGTGGDPKFLWNGRTGYRQMNNPFSSIYVRARHYATSSGRWTTGFRGGLIRSVNDYLYALANPLEYVEPTGSYAYQNPKQKKPKQKIDPWESGNCQKAKESAKAELGKCFNAKDMDTLADIMMCMAFGESDCSGKGTSPLGMYQLTCKDFNWCIPKGDECCDCEKNGTQRGCNTRATVNLIAEFVDFYPGMSFGDQICRYWGVFYPCKPAKRLGPQIGPNGPNTKTMDCLKKKGIDIFKMNPPAVKPDCYKCPNKHKGM